MPNIRDALSQKSSGFRVGSLPQTDSILHVFPKHLSVLNTNLTAVPKKSASESHSRGDHLFPLTSALRSGT